MIFRGVVETLLVYLTTELKLVLILFIAGVTFWSQRKKTISFFTVNLQPWCKKQHPNEVGPATYLQFFFLWNREHQRKFLECLLFCNQSGATRNHKRWSANIKHLTLQRFGPVNDLTKNKLAFFLPLQFHCFQILKLLQCKFKCNVQPKNNYERYNYTEKSCWITQIGSEMARQFIWEQKRQLITSDAADCFCFMCNSKGHATCSWLRLIDPYFFCSLGTFTQQKGQTCIIVNFHSLHSLLGLFGSSWIKWLALVNSKK